jgi:hypothetical protein
MRTYIYLSLFVVLLAGCQKAQDELPGSADPVFYVNVTGLPVSPITAGIGSYYMFTRYSIENQNLTTIGTLGLETCDDGNCNSSLRFELTIPLGAAEKGADSIFHLGEYVFKSLSGPDSIVKRLVLRAEPHEAVDSVIWIIDQTNKTVGDSAILYFQQTDDIHLIELQTIKNGTLRSRVTSAIDLAGQKSFPAVGITTGYDTSALINGFNILAVSTGSPIVSYDWSNDSIGQSFFDQGFGIAQGAIEVVATDAQGEIATAKLAQLSNAEIFRKTTGFSYTSTEVNLGPQGNLNGVAIQWIDADGFVWRSDWGDQNVDRIFAVLSSESYDLNEKGQKTRKMRVAFKCLVYNDLGEAKSLEGTGVIGMAYP